MLFLVVLVEMCAVKVMEKKGMHCVQIQSGIGAKV